LPQIGRSYPSRARVGRPPIPVSAGQVVFDAVGPSSAGAGAAGQTSPLTWSHTCSGTDRLLLVGVSDGGTNVDTQTVSATYNGVAMSLLGSVLSNGAVSGKARLFGLLAPDTGTNTVSVTFSGGTPGAGFAMEAGSLSFTGVEQSSLAAAVTNLTTASGSTANPSVAVSSAVGNIVVDLLVMGGPITSSADTQRWLKNINGSTGGGNGAQATQDGAASVTMNYTAPAEFWGMIGVNVVASTGAGGPAASGTVRSDTRAQALAVATKGGRAALTASTRAQGLSVAAKGAVTTSTTSARAQGLATARKAASTTATTSTRAAAQVVGIKGNVARAEARPQGTVVARKNASGVITASTRAEATATSLKSGAIRAEARAQALTTAKKAALTSSTTSTRAQAATSATKNAATTATASARAQATAVSAKAGSIRAEARAATSVVTARKAATGISTTSTRTQSLTVARKNVTGIATASARAQAIASTTTGRPVEASARPQALVVGIKKVAQPGTTSARPQALTTGRKAITTGAATASTRAQVLGTGRKAASTSIFIAARGVSTTTARKAVAASVVASARGQLLVQLGVHGARGTALVASRPQYIAFSERGESISVAYEATTYITAFEATVEYAFDASASPQQFEHAGT
jgi:hypothetical protein